MKVTKNCRVCDKKYSRPKDYSHEKWEERKFCSIPCADIGRNYVKKEKHHAWKGGITSLQRMIRTCNKYLSWRDSILERDSYQCVWCGLRGGWNKDLKKRIKLNVDHIKPLSYLIYEHDIHSLEKANSIKELWNVDNGRTLCTVCHSYRKTNVLHGDRLRYSKLKKFIPLKDRVSYGGAVIGYEEMDALLECLLKQGSNRWTVGPESIAFEEELAQKTGVKRAVVVNSGSSALLIALTALKLPKGSKVIIPAVNFPTAFNAILQCGLVPYVVDVDLKTLNLDLDEVRKAVQNEKIDAVIAVNIASNPNDLVALRDIVGDAKIVLDNCDGYGTLVDGKFAETQADVSCVSFHAAHIITTGEGGACLTDDEELADRIKKLREWGRADGTDAIYDYPGFPEDYRSRYVYEEIGFNMKPLELQCAMGRVQLKKLEDFREARLRNAKRMKEIFTKYPQFQLIDSPDNAEVCWFSFPLLCKGISRKLVMDTLEKNNIECRTIFSGNILRHPAYKDTHYVSHSEMVNADYVMKNGMFLSVHPSITEEMLDFIDKVLGDLCK